MAARPCPVLPGELVHPAAAPAITTLSKAYEIRLAALRLAALLLAGCPAPACDKPSAEVTRLWRHPRSQNQFMSFLPLKAGLV